MRLSPAMPRRAFTLVELMVVIALIGLLATLLFFSFPTFSGQNTVSSGADRIVGALLIARQRAKRDGRITGLRVTQDPTGAWTVLQFVQQPDDFVITFPASANLFPGTIATMGITPVNPAGIPNGGYPPLGWTHPGQPMANTIFFHRQTMNIPGRYTALFPNYGSDDTILPGDYIELYRGGFVHQIVAINSPASAKIPFDSLTVFGATLHPSALAANPRTTPSVVGPITYNSPVPNYRIIRQPRILNGEAPVTLPYAIGLDVSSATINNATTPLTNLIQTQIPPPPAWLPKAEWPPQPPLYADILFTPSGAVTGQGASTGQIYLWVRDLTADNTTNLLNGWPVIVSVQMSTGFISSQQVVDPNDPFALTRDGRGSGS